MWNWWFSRTLREGGAVLTSRFSLQCPACGRGSQRGPGGQRWYWLLLMPALVIAPSAMAATVYRSVDDDGVVVFSDQPPAAGTDADILHIPVSPSQADAAERLQALRQSNDRLAQARREREAARARAAAPSIRYTAPVGVAADARGPLPQPVRALWPFRFPGTHYAGPLRPRPAPGPVSPAPVPPGFRVIQPGNQQLMRPIVSSRD